jgi:hypothetical protein
MPSFDFAIGLTANGLDAVSVSLYQQVPQLFKGTEQASVAGIEYTVDWNVETPATFDLSDAVGAQTALRAHMETAEPPAGVAATGAPAPSAALLDLAAANAAAFAFTYQTVGLALSAPGVSPAVLTITLTATAHMAVSGTEQTMVIDGMTTPPQSDPVQNWIVQNVVLPRMLASSQQIFGGVTIPAITLPGLTLGSPVPFVQDNTLIAVANLATEPQPDVPAAGTVDWPGSDFFTLISQNAFQALTSNYIATSQSTMSDSGSNGNHWGGDDWSYSLGIGSPRVTLNTDASITLGAAVQGSVAASIYVLYVPIGVGFTAYTEPALSAQLSVSVEGSSLVVRTTSVAPFVLLVAPSGSVPEEIVGGMLEPIVFAVVAAFSPFVNAFLGGIEFASFDIPSYTVSVGGVTITMAPTNLTVFTVDGMLALAGGTAISG